MCWRCVVSSSDETETVSVSELCGIDAGCCDAMTAMVFPVCAEMAARSMYQDECTSYPGIEEEPLGKRAKRETRLSRTADGGVCGACEALGPGYCESCPRTT